MTTDPYRGPAGSPTFSSTELPPVEPGYGVEDPYTDPDPVVGTGATVAPTEDGPSTRETAKAAAGQVKDTAADAAQQVAGTAKDEAGNVVAEAKSQAAGLLDQVKGEAGSQAGTQQQRLAGIVGSYAEELGSMASGSKESGPLTDLAHQASQRAGAAAHWLENHEPAELLDEARRFARRRPGAFLLGAVVAGVVVGRLTRGAVDDARSDAADTGSTQAVGATGPSYVAPAQDLGAGQAGGYGLETEPVPGYAEDVQVAGVEVTEPYGATATGYQAGYQGTSGTTPGDVTR